MRKGFTLVEMVVASALALLVMAALGFATSLASRRNADSQALFEVLRGQALLDATLGADLDRLVVEPGRPAVEVSEEGHRIAFRVARAIPDRAYAAVATERVVYELAAGALVRNGKAVPGLTLSDGYFETERTGRTFRLTAAVLVAGGRSAWRSHEPMIGAVHEIARSWAAPADLPTLARRIL